MEIKLGLWESTMVTQITGVTMPTMPQLTPEQLSKSQHDTPGAGAPQSRTSKMCIAREQLSKPLVNYGDKNCTSKLVSTSASMQQIHTECSPGNNKMVGDLTLQRLDPEHFKGDMILKASGDGSTPGAPASMHIKVSFTERFLASDCGDVKPSGDR